MPADNILDAQSEASDASSWGDIDDNDEGESEALIVSLFDERVFTDAMSMISYCKESYNFDFLATRDRLSLDFYGSIKLINFIRSSVRDGQSLPSEITMEQIQDDVYLRPVLGDDALIISLDDLPQENQQIVDGGRSEDSITGSSREDGNLRKANADLQAQLDSLSQQFANYRLAVQQTLDKRWGVDGDDDSGESLVTTQASTSKPRQDDSEYYWESYAYHDIHETMLKDAVRTDAYRDFIYNNKHLIAGKVVLDIGCGTGILSMFCAKAGARQVIAVDNSAIIDKARENIFRNGLDDKITCLRGRVEDVTMPVDKVDIIVSEWMGYCLLYEAMLPSVIWARDRYLKPDGLLIPSHATIFIAPVSDSEYVSDHVDFWQDVYGFDMTAMKSGLCSDVRVEHVPESIVCGSPSTVAFNLYKTTVADLTFKIDWRSTISSDVDEVDGFLIWFDMYFAPDRHDPDELIVAPAKEWAAKRNDSIAFTTGPMGIETHWKQGLLLYEHDDSSPKFRTGEEIQGTLSFSVLEDHARGLSIQVDWETSPGNRRSQSWNCR